VGTSLEFTQHPRAGEIRNDLARVDVQTTKGRELEGCEFGLEYAQRTRPPEITERENELVTTRLRSEVPGGIFWFGSHDLPRAAVTKSG
jgi:hypothetical protein